MYVRTYVHMTNTRTYICIYGTYVSLGYSNFWSGIKRYTYVLTYRKNILIPYFYCTVQCSGDTLWHDFHDRVNVNYSVPVRYVLVPVILKWFQKFFIQKMKRKRFIHISLFCSSFPSIFTGNTYRKCMAPVKFIPIYGT